MRIDLNPDAWAPLKQGVIPQPKPSLTYAEQTVIGRLTRLLQEHSERVRGALTEGTLPTLEAYREAVGELRGYSNALKAIREAEREASGEPEAVEKKEPLYGV